MGEQQSYGGGQDVKSKRHFSTENLECVSDKNLGNRKSLTEKSKEDNREPKCGGERNHLQ